MSYPTKITEKILSASKDIEDLTIIQDITDTEYEIGLKEKVIEGQLAEAQLGFGTPQGKIADFRTTGNQQVLSEMKDFVAFLKLLQVARVKLS